MMAQGPVWLEIITVSGEQAVTEAGQKKTIGQKYGGL
jgi:hypothetical protein